MQSINVSQEKAELDADLATMREAGTDAMFLADLEEAMEDFHHADIGALWHERSPSRLLKN